MATSLFHKPGYISLKTYVDDIEYMRKHGPWKLPFGVSDRIHFFFLSLMAKFSWFSDILYVEHPYLWSPSYSILCTYLHKNHILDEVKEGMINFSDYFAFSAKKSVYVNERPRTLSGFGVDCDSSRALSKTLGEILERTISGLGDENRDIISASPESFQRRHEATLYPPRYHRFLEDQKDRYRELQHHSSHKIDWVAGKNLVTRERTYIPRQMTSWFGFGNARVFRDILCNATSNGCAGYFTREGAVLRGLLEVINRDALLVHWLTMIPPRLVKNNTLPSSLRDIVESFKSRGVTLYILDVTALSVPSICIVALNEQSRIPRIIMSGASAVSFKQAIEDSLTETISLTGDLLYGPEKPSAGSRFILSEPFVSNLGKNERPLYWMGGDRVAKFKWFLSGEEVPYESLHGVNEGGHVGMSDAQQLRECLKRLKKHGEGYYPIVYYPQNPLQEMLGFYVAQVYLPKAFPLYLLECYGTFDSDRLSEFALSRGRNEWKLNQEPHPFY